MSKFIQGVSYPLAIVDGNLALSCDEELIADHIVSMLEIEPSENPMRPEYGISGALFESQRSAAEYSAYVSRQMTAYIPQASISVAGEIGDNGALGLQIDWQFNGVTQDSILVS